MPHESIVSWSARLLHHSWNDGSSYRVMTLSWAARDRIIASRVWRAAGLGLGDQPARRSLADSANSLLLGTNSCRPNAIAARSSLSSGSQALANLALSTN